MLQRRTKDVITCNATISACEKAGHWQLSTHLLALMPDLEVSPDVISYSAAISSCEKRGKWQLALQLFNDMPRADLRPNIVSYDATLSACATRLWCAGDMIPCFGMFESPHLGNWPSR